MTTIAIQFDSELSFGRDLEMIKSHVTCYFGVITTRSMVFQVSRGNNGVWKPSSEWCWLAEDNPGGSHGYEFHHCVVITPVPAA